jgi:hypothetical protein
MGGVNFVNTLKEKEIRAAFRETERTCGRRRVLGGAAD